MKFFCVNRLEKGIHYKSNYKGSVKESLNKCINFYLLKSFRLTFITQYMWVAWWCSGHHLELSTFIDKEMGRSVVQG